jgi:hypothetical protein
MEKEEGTTVGNEEEIGNAEGEEEEDEIAVG